MRENYTIHNYLKYLYLKLYSFSIVSIRNHLTMTTSMTRHRGAPGSQTCWGIR